MAVMALGPTTGPVLLHTMQAEAHQPNVVSCFQGLQEGQGQRAPWSIHAAGYARFFGGITVASNETQKQRHPGSSLTYAGHCAKTGALPLDGMRGVQSLRSFP